MCISGFTAIPRLYIKKNNNNNGKIKIRSFLVDQQRAEEKNNILGSEIEDRKEIESNRKQDRRNKNGND